MSSCLTRQACSIKAFLNTPLSMTSTPALLMQVLVKIAYAGEVPAFPVLQQRPRVLVTLPCGLSLPRCPAELAS